MSNKIKLLFFILLMPSIFLGQNPIDNPGFEDWSGGEPVNWISNNIPSTVTTVTQSSTAHSGASAVKCETGNLAANPWPASLSAAGIAGDQYLPVNQNYAALSGYYQLHTSGSDYIGVAAFLYDASKTGIVASITESIDTPVDAYTHFSLDFDYSNGNGGDAAFLQLQFLTSMGIAMEIGSYFLLDDLEVSGLTSIKPDLTSKPESFELHQNFPNPFNPSTTINFAIPTSEYVILQVFNLAGQQAAELIHDRMDAGSHSLTWDAGNLPGGVYIYRLKTKTYTKSRKLLLLK